MLLWLTMRYCYKFLLKLSKWARTMIWSCYFSTNLFPDTPCVPEWNAFPSTNSFGGIKYPQYTTVDECLALCISLPSCVAVDVNNSSGNSIQCFVHNSTSKIAVKNSFTGINQYVLVSRCVNSTTGKNQTINWALGLYFF